MGVRGAEEMTRQYNINVYVPTILVFKEHINKPADVMQVRVGHHGFVRMSRAGTRVEKLVSISSADA